MPMSTPRLASVAVSSVTTKSVPIGVSESSATPVGHSLQLSGSGSAAVDFLWQDAQAETPGAPNTGQSFSGGCGSPVESYGCGLNPAGSLQLTSGAPLVGSAFGVGVDNPLGTQGVGSIPVLLVSGLPDPAYPCGTPLPGKNGEGTFPRSACVGSGGASLCAADACTDARAAAGALVTRPT